MRGLKPPGATSSTSATQKVERKRLGSWKEIANYLGKTVRTVQRWEEKEGLPVRRLVHDSGATVFAYQHEIDRWLNRRSLVIHGSSEDPAEAPAASAPETTQSSIEPGAGTQTGKPSAAGVRVITVTRVIVTLIVVLSAVALLWSMPWSERGAPAVDRAPAPILTELLTTDAGIEAHPALSPDGRQVAYTWTGPDQQVDLYVRLVGVDGVLRLTDSTAVEESPAWSPDGDHIVFVRRSGTARRQLVVVPALGGAERVVHEFTVPDNFDTARTIYSGIDWSPDGRTLAFTEGTRKPYRQWVTLLDIESGERVILTDPPTGMVDVAPVFSPAGGQLAFTRVHSPLNGSVYVVDLDSGQSGVSAPRALPGAMEWNTDPAWTPDGQDIVFTSGRWPRTGLWRTAADGSGEPLLLVGADQGGEQPTIAAVNGGSSWRLVYARRSMENDIWAIDLATGDEQRLFGSSQRERFPYTLHDGRIAFISDRTGYREIWVGNADGSNEQQWTDHRSTYIWHPTISAATGVMAYAVAKDGLLQAYLRDGPLAPARPVFDEPASDYDLAWSRDGRTLYIASVNRAEGQPATWAVRPGEAPPVVIAPDFYEVVGDGPNAEWLYMVNGSALDKQLWRVPVSGGEVEQVEVGEGPVHSFTLGPDGVYFLAVTGEHHEIRRWRWPGGGIDTVRVLEHIPEYGMAISADGRQALLARLELQRADLVQAGLDQRAP